MLLIGNKKLGKPDEAFIQAEYLLSNNKKNC